MPARASARLSGALGVRGCWSDMAAVWSAPSFADRLGGFGLYSGPLGAVAMDDLQRAVHRDHADRTRGGRARLYLAGSCRLSAGGLSSSCPCLGRRGAARAAGPDTLPPVGGCGSATAASGDYY